MKRSQSNAKTAILVHGSASLNKKLAATAAETELNQADVIRQSLKLGLPTLRSRLGRRPRRRLSLVQHFVGFKGLELPSYLVSELGKDEGRM